MIIPLPLPVRQFGFPEEGKLVCETFGFGTPRPWKPLGFTLTRRKEGTEIGLQQDGHWWNLSHMTGTYPPGFAAAREWMRVYSAQHGRPLPQELRWNRRTYRYEPVTTSAKN